MCKGDTADASNWFVANSLLLNNDKTNPVIFTLRQLMPVDNIGRSEH